MAEVAVQPLRALIEAHREEIRTVVARHHGRRVAVFGSVARGEETSESDIDLLVEFGAAASLFDLIHLNDDLERLLGPRVDVVSLYGLKPRDDDVRADAIWL